MAQIPFNGYARNERHASTPITWADMKKTAPLAAKLGFALAALVGTGVAVAPMLGEQMQAGMRADTAQRMQAASELQMVVFKHTISNPKNGF